MSEDNASHRTGPQKLVSVLVVLARFAAPIQILMFLVMANVLTRWVAVPIAHGISAFLVSLPFYWLIPRRKFRYSVYVAFCALLAAALAVLEHLLLG